MASIIEALDLVASKGWCKEWQNPAWRQFVLTGDQKHLKNLPKFRDHSWLPEELLSALATPDKIDEGGKRFLQACRAAGHPQALGAWIQQCVTKGGHNPTVFTQACALATELGCPKLFLAAQVAQFAGPLRESDGSITAAGSFILSLDDNALEDLLRSFPRSRHAVEIAWLFIANAPQRWKKVMEIFNKKGDSKHLNPQAWVLALTFLFVVTSRNVIPFGKRE